MDMGWLAGFFQWIGDVLKRIWPWSYVRSYEQAARWRRGKPPVIVGPGLRENVPLLDEFEAFDMRPQWLDCPDQPLTTHDGESITLSGMIRMQIVDLLLFVTRTQDPEDDLKALVMAEQSTLIANLSYTDTDNATIEKKIRRPLRAAARKIGVEVIDYRANQNVKIGEGVYWHGGDGMRVVAE